MASLGELERSVMEVLWTSDAALTANELRDALAHARRRRAARSPPPPCSPCSRGSSARASSSRTREMRPHRYRALLSREEHTAELMHEVLDRSSDRDAALARFVGTVSAGEAATLRRLLDELARR